MKKFITAVLLFGTCTLHHGEVINLDVNKLPSATAYGLQLLPYKDKAEKWDRNWPKGRENTLAVDVRNISARKIKYIDSNLEAIVCAVLKDGTIFNLSHPEQYNGSFRAYCGLPSGEEELMYFYINPNTIAKLNNKIANIRIIIKIYDSSGNIKQFISDPFDPGCLHNIITKPDPFGE